MTGSCKKDGERIFTKADSDRTRSNREPRTKKEVPEEKKKKKVIQIDTQNDCSKTPINSIYITMTYFINLQQFSSTEVEHFHITLSIIFLQWWLKIIERYLKISIIIHESTTEQKMTSSTSDSLALNCF